jgi:hypothetical protein
MLGKHLGVGLVSKFGSSVRLSPHTGPSFLEWHVFSPY